MYMERGLSKTDLLTQTLGWTGSYKLWFPKAYFCYHHPFTFSYSTNSILLLHLACVNPFTTLQSIFVGEKICFEHCFNPSKARFTENVIERGASLEWERGANIDVIQKLCLFPACCYGWFWIWFNAKSDVTLTIGISFFGEDVDSCSHRLILNRWLFPTCCSEFCWYGHLDPAICKEFLQKMGKPDAREKNGKKEKRKDGNMEKFCDIYMYLLKSGKKSCWKVRQTDILTEAVLSVFRFSLASDFHNSSILPLSDFTSGPYHRKCRQDNYCDFHPESQSFAEVEK